MVHRRSATTSGANFNPPTIWGVPKRAGISRWGIATKVPVDGARQSRALRFPEWVTTIVSAVTKSYGGIVPGEIAGLANPCGCLDSIAADP